MKLLNKLTYNNLKLNKKRTIIGIIGILLAVALLTTVSTFAMSAKDSLVEFEKKTEGNFHYEFEGVNADELGTFENNRNVESYFYTKGLGYAKLEDSQNDYKPYAYVTAYDAKGLEELKVNLVEGRLPQNENEILMPTHVVTNGRLDIKVGDTITLNVGKRTSGDFELNQGNPFLDENDERIIDTTTHTYKIVGMIERPGKIVEPNSAPGYTFITTQSKFDGNITVFVRFTKKALKDLDSVVSAVLGVDKEAYKVYYNKYFNWEDYSMEERTELLEKAEKEIEKAKYDFTDNSRLIDLEGMPLDDAMIKSLFAVAVIVTLIIITSSVFCIRNLFLISTTEKVKQYGVLASIGATRKQIKKSVLFEALLMGLVGIPLGLTLGLLATFILIKVCNWLLVDISSMFNLTLIFNVSPWAIIISVILSIITIYLSALKSARMAARLTPLDAIRSTADIKVDSKKVKCPKIISKLFKIGGTISYKNMKRNKKKYKTAIVSIFLCVATFIPLSYFVSLTFSITRMAYKEFSYDMRVFDKSGDKKGFEEKLNEIARLDEVKDYSIVSNTAFLIEDQKYLTEDYINFRGPNYSISQEDSDIDKQYYSMEFVALDDRSYASYVKSLGLDVSKTKDKVILLNKYSGMAYNKEKGSTDLAEIDILNVSANSTVKGYFMENGLDKELDITIAAITDKKPIAEVSTSSATMIVNMEYFSSLVENNGGYGKILYISTDKNMALGEEIEEILKGYDYGIDDIKEQAQAMKSIFTIIAIFMYGFITVIALIGITNIVNTLNTSMELRSREFATLKSLGMTSNEFSSMVNLESIFIGTKALVFGVPIGLVLSYLLNKVLTNGSFTIAFNPPILATLGAVVFVYALLLLIMHYAIKKVNKKNIIDTIRNENI